MVGTLANWGWLRRPMMRRVLFAVLILLFVLLTFFPERHRAAVTLTPSDPTTLGFNPTQVQLGALNSVFGNQAAIEIALKVASSVQVRDTIATQLKLQQRLDLDSREATHRWLKRHLDIRALRGGIIQIQMRDADPAFAREIVAACAEATRQQLAQINRQQTAYKHDILLKLSTDASDRLARAQGAFDTFRLGMRSPDPTLETGLASARINALQDALRQKQLELASARQAYSDGNLRVRQLQAEAATLQSQLAQAQGTAPGGSQGVGRAVQTSTQYRKLQRELTIAQSLYDNYIRLLESTAVDDMTSTANIRVLEPPFVDTARQLNYPALAMALALALLLAAIEFYSLRPPASGRVTVRETYA
jgi:tyrosine-protein kinase Etk/Wzc